MVAKLILPRKAMEETVEILVAAREPLPIIAGCQPPNRKAHKGSLWADSWSSANTTPSSKRRDARWRIASSSLYWTHQAVLSETLRGRLSKRAAQTSGVLTDQGRASIVGIGMPTYGAPPGEFP